jgi:hypothetical protein
VPEVRSELDVSNIDDIFTSEEPRESLREPTILAAQKIEKFTYVKEGVL